MMNDFFSVKYYLFFYTKIIIINRNYSRDTRVGNKEKTILINFFFKNNNFTMSQNAKNVLLP